MAEVEVGVRESWECEGRIITQAKGKKTGVKEGVTEEWEGKRKKEKS